MIAVGLKKYDGSSVSEGTTYQDIPSRPDIPFHRGRSEQRAERICELVDVKGKTVLDLGCSVGTMSNVFKSHGADVIGVDHDADSIELAKSVYPNVKFDNRDIDMVYIDSLPRYDVVIWTSQFMWMAKQHGMDYALECLWKLSTKCDVLVFESAGVNDGDAPTDIRQEGYFKLLCQNTCFQDITDHGPWNDGWTPRNVFVCRDPFNGHEGQWSKVELSGHGKVKKIFKDNPFSRELKKREYEAIEMLRGGTHYPIVIHSDENSITMTWRGIKAKWISEFDLIEIVSELDDNKIIHRDIKPDHILWDGDNLTLIDFSFSTIGKEVTNYHYDLGGTYKCPYGFNDEYSLRKIQSELIRGREEKYT